MILDRSGNSDIMKGRKLVTFCSRSVLVSRENSHFPSECFHFCFGFLFFALLSVSFMD